MPTAAAKPRGDGPSLTMELLYASEIIRISFWPQIPCLEWQALGPMTSREFRRTNETLFSYLLHYRKQRPNIRGLLFDTCLLGPVASEDLVWAASDMDPRLADNGIVRQAFVTPADIFGQLSVDDYIQMAAGGRLLNQMFTNREEAMSWLQTAQ